MTAAKARAAAQARKVAEIEDVTWLAPYVLNHRVSAEEASPHEIVASAVQSALGS
jgi:MoxR-like ATPase